MKEILSGAVLTALLLSGAVLAWFEAIYLRDQARDFRAAAIHRWMWAVRLVSIASLAGAVAVGIAVISSLGYTVK